MTANTEPFDREKLVRLETIASVAFPDGSVTVATLRREIKAGRLKAWLIGAKHMTTLIEIERMLEQCRVKPKDQGSSGESHDQPAPEKRPTKASSSSATMTDTKRAQAAAMETARALKERLLAERSAEVKVRPRKLVR